MFGGTTRLKGCEVSCRFFQPDGEDPLGGELSMLATVTEILADPWSGHVQFKLWREQSAQRGLLSLHFLRRFRHVRHPHLLLWRGRVGNAGFEIEM